LRTRTHVAMEATGVYWKPVWDILEEKFTLILANAAHVAQPSGAQEHASMRFLNAT
jgi:transposase